MENLVMRILILFCATFARKIHPIGWNGEPIKDGGSPAVEGGRTTRTNRRQCGTVQNGLKSHNEECHFVDAELISECEI